MIADLTRAELGTNATLYDDWTRRRIEPWKQHECYSTIETSHRQLSIDNPPGEICEFADAVHDRQGAHYAGRGIPPTKTNDREARDNAGRGTKRCPHTSGALQWVRPRGR